MPTITITPETTVFITQTSIISQLPKTGASQTPTLAPDGSPATNSVSCIIAIILIIIGTTSYVFYKRKTGEK
jgi:hypothetical protein